tara:strand:- start:187 stop:504 length:318 start_codon:yes stop_codon:yes gene_type:complete
MTYIEIIEGMIKKIFETERDDDVKEYYWHLLKQVRLGKKNTSIPFKLATMNQEKFIKEYLNQDILFNEEPKNGNMKKKYYHSRQVQISMYFGKENEWHVIATGEI